MRSAIRRSITVGVMALLAAACSPATTAPATTTTTIATLVTTSVVEESSSTTTSPPTTTSVAATTTEGPQATDFVPAMVDRLIASDSFSGVVLLAKDDEVIWTRQAGLADVVAETPIHAESRFNLGSMNKMFTAVGILQLMKEGLLTLDGTVSQYLPDYPNAEVAETVTIEQLLMHTSGLGDVFTEEFGTDPHRYRTNQDFLELFVDDPPAFPPGRQWSYSNAGFVVLGLIIEELSGLSYDDYVHDFIFEPSGMLATAAHDVEDEFENLAIGYTELDINSNPTGVLSDHRPLMPGRGFAAGGGYSTVGDLHRFRNALFNHELLSPESTELLITGQIELQDQAMYAFGFFDRIQSGERVVGHGGGAPGVCSSLSMYPDSGYTVVVLSNSDDDCFSVLDYLRLHPPG